MIRFVQGIWYGMLSGTVLQTIILFLIIYKTNWNKEVCSLLNFPSSCFKHFQSLCLVVLLFHKYIFCMQASIAEDRIRKWGGDTDIKENSVKRLTATETWSNRDVFSDFGRVHGEEELNKLLGKSSFLSVMFSYNDNGGCIWPLF